MKNIVRTLAIVATIALLSTACKDDTVTSSPDVTVRNVGYIACGEQHSSTATGDDEWHALLDQLFSAAEGGCRVTFWNPDALGAKQADTVTISTADRETAYRWGEEMYNQGYTVSIIFDSTTHVYNGTAIILTTTGYTPIPLSEYLPGTWVIDSTGLWCFYLSHYMPYPWDSLPNLAWLWKETIPHSALFKDVLYFTDDSVTTPYRNFTNWIPSEYVSMGYIDSTETHHYSITNDFTVIVDSVIIVDNAVTYTLNRTMHVVQLSHDYMLLYFYKPVFGYDCEMYMQSSWAFIRQ